MDDCKCYGTAEEALQCRQTSGLHRRWMMDRSSFECIRCKVILPDKSPFTICDACWDATHIPIDKEPVFTQADLARARQAGYDEAREQAAKIIESQPVPHVDGSIPERARQFTIAAAAHQIRAMRPRDGGE